MTNKEFQLNMILAKLIGFMFNGAYAINPLAYAAEMTEEDDAILKSANVSITKRGTLLTAAELADSIRKALKKINK